MMNTQSEEIKCMVCFETNQQYISSLSSENDDLQIKLIVSTHFPFEVIYNNLFLKNIQFKTCKIISNSTNFQNITVQIFRYTHLYEMFSYHRKFS